MKNSKKIVLILALVLMVCCLLAACTENTKWDAVQTDTTYTQVTSNGGVAVQYGNYLYFINGYAGEAALNTFGDVITGAVCRVEIKKGQDGLALDYDTFQVVVPKNVYGADTTNGGIYIANDYIYYHTTSVDKNSKREYKTNEGVLMRTKIDGTGTETLKNFSDNSTVFRVSGNYLVYTSKDAESNTVLKAIKLDDMSEITIESKHAIAYQFSDNYLVYTTYNYDRTTNSSSDYLVKLFDFRTGKISLLLSSDIYNVNGLLFTTTIKAIRENENTIYLFYTKDDNSVNNLENGYYFCCFPKANPVYDVKFEYRMTSETETTTYDNFYLLNNGWILAYHEKKFDIYNDFVKGSGTYGTAKRMASANSEEDGMFTSYTLTGATAIVDVYENENEVYAYFTTSPSIDSKTYTALNYVKLFNKVNDTYTIAIENVAVFYYFNYNSSYTTYEVSDLYYYEATGSTAAKAILYLNSDVGEGALAYYHILQSDNDKENAEKKAGGRLIGKIDSEKLVDLISSGKVEK